MGLLDGVYAMPEPSIRVSLERYLDTSYSPDCDWVDGELRERVAGERPHAAMLGTLVHLFTEHEDDCGVKVLPILRVRTSESRVRVADVCVLSGDAPYEPVVRTAPLLCVEVLSPGDMMQNTLEKASDFLGMGVLAVWLINPWLNEAFLMSQDGSLRRERIGLEVSGTRMRLDVEELFARARLDEI